jgi:hypothetical protein
MQPTIFVTKASGEKQEFSAKKLMHSLMNAGATEKTAKAILHKVETEMVDGMHTKKIYNIAFGLLKKERTQSALRYKLKKAIMELGPTGYPFEKFIGQLFEKQGFVSEVGITVSGACIQHEMDVIATKPPYQYILECKYSQDQSKQVAIQVPLYVHSRVEDITDYRKNLSMYNGLKFITGVVTNTRFTTDSIQYGMCKGMYLLSWDYPINGSLKQLVDTYDLFPITVLNTLSKKDKDVLIRAGFITCSDLRKTKDWEKEIYITPQKLVLVQKELDLIT